MNAKQRAAVSIAACVGLTWFVQPASSADVTINFDDLPANTVLSNQYSSKGVTFGSYPPNASAGAPWTIESANYAHSGSQFAAMGAGSQSWIAFPGSVDHVSVYVSIYSPTYAGAQSVGLIALDPNGAVVGNVSAQADPDAFGGTPLSLSPTGGAKIAYVRVVTPDIPDCCYVAAAIDDLTFGPVNSTTGPDFAIIPQESSIALPLNAQTNLPITLDRYGGSTGIIHFSYTAPSGLSVSFNPQDPTGGGPVFATFTSATPLAAGASGTVTITASPVPSAGSTPHSVTISYAIQAMVNLVVQGIDVTQGAMNTGALQPTLTGGDYPGMQLIPQSQTPDQVSFNGTPVTNPLGAHNRTVALVYVDAQGAPSSGINGVNVVLHGYSNGQELPSSPLNWADYSPNALADIGGSPFGVPQSERIGSTNVFMFTLPDAWTEGTISLIATVMPPPPSFGGPPNWVACTSLECQTNMSFTLNNVTFQALPYVVIAPLRLAQPSDPTLPSSTDLRKLFKRALQTEPGANQFVVLDYVGTVDPTPEINGDTAAKKNVNNDYEQAIVDWTLPSTSLPPLDIICGVQGTQNGETENSIWDQPAVTSAHCSVNFTRPLTSTAHELGHALGRNHADDSAAAGQKDGSNSTGCGGGGGPWPPDGLGYLQGIGFDYSTSPYTFLASSGTTQFYDKMSYCDTIIPETNRWNSPYGWLHSVQTLLVFGQKTNRGSTAPSGWVGQQGIEGFARRVVPTAEVLLVQALATPDGIRIAQVARTTTPPSLPAEGPFKLTARDASGHVLATTPMRATPFKMDPTSVEVEGTIPAKNAASIEITKDGVVVASRKRNAHAPTVQLVAPAEKAELGDADTNVVRWSATGDSPLKITISYSIDDGKTWRSIYNGSDTGQVTLPNHYFAASDHARVRIDANDGFDTASVMSKSLKAKGSPPTVIIDSPTDGQSYRGEALIHLRGEALDDAPSPLRGKSVTWSIDGNNVGSGLSATAHALSPGEHHVTLTATDKQGRKGSASITIHVAPVVLPFLDLRVPSTILPNATALTFTARSTIPATLVVRDQKYTIGQQPTGITLKTPGNQPIPLALSVTAQGLTHQLAFLVVRKPLHIPPATPHPPLTP